MGERKIKRHCLKVECVDDQISFRARNDGFNPAELIGILYMKISDVTKQFEGEINPELIKREVISG